MRCPRRLMIKRISRKEMRKRRHLRVRKKVSGTAERPRLCVFRSLRHMYAQLIRDDTGETLVSASTLDPELRPTVSALSKKEAAKAVGELLGRRALARGIRKASFDRNGFRYHGRVAALAEGARAAGLEF